jgi:hypothetical protein
VVHQLLYRYEREFVVRGAFVALVVNVLGDSLLVPCSAVNEAVSDESRKEMMFPAVSSS